METTNCSAVLKIFHFDNKIPITFSDPKIKEEEQQLRI